MILLMVYTFIFSSLHFFPISFYMQKGRILLIALLCIPTLLFMPRLGIPFTKFCLMKVNMKAKLNIKLKLCLIIALFRYAMPHRGTFWKKKKNKKATDKIELIRSMVRKTNHFLISSFFFTQAGIEMDKESQTQNDKTVNDRNNLSDSSLVGTISNTGLMKECGAVVRNNPHLHANSINTPTEENNSYFII